MFLSACDFVDCKHSILLWTEEQQYLEQLMNDETSGFNEKILQFIEHFSYSVIYRYKIDNLKWSIPFDVSAVFDYKLNKQFNFYNIEKLLKNRICSDILRPLQLYRDSKDMTLSGIASIDFMKICLGKKIYTNLFPINSDKNLDSYRRLAKHKIKIQLQLWKL